MEHLITCTGADCEQCDEPLELEQTQLEVEASAAASPR